MRAFYAPAGRGRFSPSPWTSGPWSASSQHGGPPAALLTRAVEALLPGGGSPRLVARFTMELLGAVPLTPLRVEASVVRPGRSVQMCEATLVDEDRGRACARATAWLFPDTTGGPGHVGDGVPHHPRDGVPKESPPSWSRGYLDAVEWRWVRGAVTEPGPGVVWMRPRVDLVDGEPMSPVQRLMTCVDSASGISAALDPAVWAFLNTELTVHLLRRPAGEWVCLDAETVLGPGSVATAVSRVYDERGLVARSAQALLVSRR